MSVFSCYKGKGSKDRSHGSRRSNRKSAQGRPLSAPPDTIAAAVDDYATITETPPIDSADRGGEGGSGGTMHAGMSSSLGSRGVGRIDSLLGDGGGSGGGMFSSATRPGYRAGSLGSGLDGFLGGGGAGFGGGVSDRGGGSPMGGASLGGGQRGSETRDQYLCRLTEETNLQQMLGEEKIRSERHRGNFQLLKAEHRKLQSEMVGLEDKYRKMAEDKSENDFGDRRELSRAREEIATQNQKIRKLKEEIIDPSKVSALKSGLVREVEGPYRDRLEGMEVENERLRADGTKLARDLTFVTSELEQARKEATALISEKQRYHDTELMNLRRERDDLLSRVQFDSTEDVQKIRNLQRENTQLNHQVKSLHQELEEIRAQREKLGLESDHVTRIQHKQLAEFQATTRSLETEKAALRQQCDSVASELSAATEAQNDLSKTILDLEDSVTSLKGHLEEVTHRSKLEISELKMAAVKEKGELGREKAALGRTNEDLKSQIERLERTLTQREGLLKEKEQENARKIAQVREEEFRRTLQLEEEKVAMETRLQSLDSQRKEAEARGHAERERAEVKVQDAVAAKEASERALSDLKSQAPSQESLSRELDHERIQVQEMKGEIMRLNAHNQGLVASENELTDLVTHLRHKLQKAGADLRLSREAIRDERETVQREGRRRERAWEEEKSDLQRRADTSEEDLKDTRRRREEESKAWAKKKSQYTKLITRLKQKCELAVAEMTESHVQLQGMKHYLPPEKGAKLKQQLKELQSRHDKFRAVILSGTVSQVPIGERSFGEATVNNTRLDVTPPLFSGGAQNEDMVALQRRMDEFGVSQDQQLEEMNQS